MASPVGHTLAGFVVYEVLALSEQKKANFNDWKIILACVCFANLPDIDFLLGYVFHRDPQVLHSGITHTLAFALIISLLASRVNLFGPYLKTFVVVLMLIGSHLFLDMSSGEHPGGLNGAGVMLFYPFATDRLSSPLTLFFGVRHRTIQDLFSTHNALGVLWELFIFSPIIFFIHKAFQPAKI